MKEFGCAESLFGYETSTRPERPFPLRPGREFGFPVQNVDELLFAAAAGFYDVLGIQGMPCGG